MPFVAWAVRTDIKTGSKQKTMLLKVSKVKEPPLSMPSISSDGRFSFPPFRQRSQESFSSSDGAVCNKLGKDRRKSEPVTKACERCKKKTGHKSESCSKVAGVRYHEDSINPEKETDNSDLKESKSKDYRQARHQYNVYEDRLLPTVDVDMPVRGSTNGQSNILRRARAMRPRPRVKKNLPNHHEDEADHLKVIQGTTVNGSTGSDKLDKSSTKRTSQKNDSTYLSKSGRGRFGLTSYTAHNTRIEFATPLTVHKPGQMTMTEWLRLISTTNDPHADSATYQTRLVPLHIPLRVWRPELKQVLTNSKVDLHQKSPAVGGSLAASKGSYTARSIQCLGTAKLGQDDGKIRSNRLSPLVTQRTVKSATF